MIHNDSGYLIYEVGDAIFYAHVIPHSSAYGKENTVIIHKGTIKMVTLELGGKDLYTVESLTGARFSLIREQLNTCYANAYAAGKKLL